MIDDNEMARKKNKAVIKNLILMFHKKSRGITGIQEYFLYLQLNFAKMSVIYNRTVIIC